MKRIISTIAFILLSILISPAINIFAAEKDYAFTISKEYEAGKISISLSDNDDYEIVAVSPDDKEYIASDISDTEKEIVINEKMKKGEWRVHIIKATEGDSDESINAKIKFEGSMELIKDTSKEITVASDIVGLSMYFKDDNFVAEWTDTTIGNVDIEVTNEKTAETLGKETVQGRHYELPLDKNVESIIVKIVPSTSANEKGAEKYFTYKFDNNPKATVTYEDLAITNKDTIGVHIVVEENEYKAMMMNNDKEISITETLKPGEYDFTIPTEVGDNNYLVYIIDEAGNMRSTAGFVEKDVVAPILQLEKEYVNINTEDESIEFAGKVEDYNTFTINDTDVKVEGDHTFKYTYELKEGLNTVYITASDEAGNVSEYTATITRIIPEENPIPWLKIIIIVCAVGLAGVYIYEVLKGKDKKTSDSNKKTAKDNKKPPITNKSKVYEILELLIPCAVIIIIFKVIILISVAVSSSMEPTIMTGSTDFYNRLYYNNHEPQRGDIIIFYSREYSEYFGKRIIGISGDHIEFRDGYVVINGQYLDESAYIGEDVETNPASTDTFDVPEGYVFVMGDNRENSMDSRYWKEPYIAIDDIVGKYMGVIDFSIQYDVINRFKDMTSKE